MGTLKREVVGWEMYKGDGTGFLEGLATGAREVTVTTKLISLITFFKRKQCQER